MRKIFSELLMSLNIGASYKKIIKKSCWCKAMDLGGIYNFISLGISMLSGIVITLSIYYLYLHAKSEESS